MVQRENKSFRRSISVTTLGFLILVLSGCSSSEKTVTAPQQEVSVQAACDQVKAGDNVVASKIFRKVREEILNSELDRKFFISAKINQLRIKLEAAQNGTNPNLVEIKSFCNGVENDIPLDKLVERIKIKNETYDPDQNKVPKAASRVTIDYLKELNDKFPHWTRDIAGPLTGSRSDFGINDVLFNANSKCSIWIFSSFNNFVKFNNAWGNTFAFNYPAEDRFGNTFVTENSIYSTTCALEYSEVFG